MKKLKALLSLMLALTLAVPMVNTVQASTVTAADFVTVKITPTDSISGTTGTVVTQSAEGHFEDGVKGVTHSYYWKFTLTKPGLVTISSTADLFVYNFIGDSDLYLGTDTQCNDKIIDGSADGETEIYENALEAGTYYIRQDIIKDGKASASGTNDIVVNPTVKLAVTVQTVNRTGNKSGSSKTNAIPVTSGKTAVGLITGQTSDDDILQNSILKQYYKVQVTGATTLNYAAVFARHEDLTHGNDKTITVIDSRGVEIDKLKKSAVYKVGSITSSVELPKKGTYYIVVSSSRFNKVELTASWKNPMKLTVNKIKKNAKKVKGTTVKGATVKVKVGKKTYKGKANSKGKFTIKTKKLKKGTKVKVTVSKSGYKSKSKTVKVK